MEISIHALREEGDLIQHGKDLAQLVISIHALREEGDLMRIYILSSSSVFLSTPSARRATAHINHRHAQCKISIHALREEGDEVRRMPLNEYGISIHALREEGDRRVIVGADEHIDFYPRPPRGGRPHDPFPASGGVPISIHALREEGDEGGSGYRLAYQDFYPRPPRGGRPRRWKIWSAFFWIFLSTPSARRATDLH